MVSVEAVEGAGVVASISGFKSPLNANAPTAMAAQAAAAAMPMDFLLSFIGWGFVSVCALAAELVIKALLSIFCRIASRFSDLLSLWCFFPNLLYASITIQRDYGNTSRRACPTVGIVLILRWTGTSPGMMRFS